MTVKSKYPDLVKDPTVESDSNWEAGSAFCVDEEDPWSDSISLCGDYNGVFEDGNGLSLFSDTDDAEIPDLPNGFEEDWSNIQPIHKS